MKKRGMSELIATVLVVLLALAAVVMIWAFLKSSLEGAGEAINLKTECLTVNVKPTGCTYNAITNATKINVQLVQGAPTYVVGIAEFSDGSTKVGNATAPAALGTQPITTSTATSKPLTAKAAAVVSDDKGNSEICTESDVTVNCIIQ